MAQREYIDWRRVFTFLLLISGPCPSNDQKREYFDLLMEQAHPETGLLSLARFLKVSFFCISNIVFNSFRSLHGLISMKDWRTVPQEWELCLMWCPNTNRQMMRKRMQPEPRRLKHCCSRHTGCQIRKDCVWANLWQTWVRYSQTDSRLQEEIMWLHFTKQYSICEGLQV